MGNRQATRKMGRVVQLKAPKGAERKDFFFFLLIRQDATSTHKHIHISRLLCSLPFKLKLA